MRIHSLARVAWWEWGIARSPFLSKSVMNNTSNKAPSEYNDNSGYLSGVFGFVVLMQELDMPRHDAFGVLVLTVCAHGLS